MNEQEHVKAGEALLEIVDAERRVRGGVPSLYEDERQMHVNMIAEAGVHFMAAMAKTITAQPKPLRAYDVREKATDTGL